MPHNNDTAKYVRHPLKALTFFVLVAGVGGVSAQSDAGTEPTPDVRPMATVRASAFGLLDTNGDGYLTRDEIEDPVTRSQFGSLDGNHDGRLDRAEYSGIAQ
ncbi:MAG: EF-hand domain-containing protein [Gammaproteobacteria bacterium]|nr:EF-hand domain-containing protein [Gammaproteobacteria bacterium]NIR82678.1 EF-hand domain-containing protein [Gammaproteobacteria bacterium]NIR89385.1 EF-hand domain-containing protein [Gammaproteobacteria bacterium]NIU03826.1 EF-hand domain-containing protein [Gammaproteobacteria bacterium]NIV51160.1 hypothetical protein [Gammaproteobacteria bacterium]